MASKKKYGVIAVAAGIVLVVCLACFEKAFNAKWRIADDVKKLKFSNESGFYDNEFDLSITSFGGKIYYTLDSSTPTVDSLEYTGPIHIGDASENENVYSMREDTSAGFRSDLIEKYSLEPDPGYEVPDYKVDKCTVVRAIAVYPDGSTSEVKTASYFVDFDEKPGYDNYNYVSVVIDPKDLFDYENGIYVTGKRFDEFLDSGAIETRERPYWYQWNANYSKENTIEKIANVQFFDTSGELLLSQRCGVDISGSGSRGFYPKGLNLSSGREIDGHDEFVVDLTGDGLYTSKYTLFSGGNDIYSRAKDCICSKLTRGMNFATTSYIPYIMFLDGEYWGVYFLVDKVDKDYLRYFYGVGKTNLLMMKDYRVTVGEEADRDIWLDFYMNIPPDLSGQDEYNFIKSEVDIDSAIDYFAVLCYISRGRDWPNSNLGMWRSKKIKGDKYSDGRWRFVLYDVNSSSIDIGLEKYDSIEHAMMENPIFGALMTNDEFKARFLDKMMELRENQFSKENVDGVIAEITNLMSEPMKYHNKRFFGGEPEGHAYLDEMKAINDFFDARRDYIPELVEKYR